MKIVRCLFLVVLLAPMFGCGLIRYAVGLEEYQAEDGTTNVRSTASDLLDKGAGLLGLLGPWGIAAGTAIGVAKRVIRHREILAHGQRDDDFDGVPDDEETKAQGTV